MNSTKISYDPFFKIDIPQLANDHKLLGNIVADSQTSALLTIAKNASSLTVVITPDTRSALKLEGQLQSLHQENVLFFPDWETLPYDSFSPHQDIISTRLSTLFELQNQPKGILILPVTTIMQRLCPTSYLGQNVLRVKMGDKFALENLRRHLEQAGYRAVDQVLEHGEFAVRGAILDLFPMGSPYPYRLDFFDDEVDSISIFDVDSQRSKEKISQINLLPAHEFPTDDKAIELFRQQFREQLTIRQDSEHIYQQVSKGVMAAGIEYWQPLFFTEHALLFDYLPKESLFITYQDNTERANQFFNDAQKRYLSRSANLMRPLLKPEQLWIRSNELNHHLKNYPQIIFCQERLRNSKRQTNLNVQPLPELTVNAQLKEPLKLLRNFIEEFSGHIVFSVESEGRRETLLSLLKPLKLKPGNITHLEESVDNKYAIIVSAYEEGFIIDDDVPTALITETNLLGNHIRQRNNEKRKSVNPETLIRNLAELKIGQPVVHIDHGVGRYGGLTTLETSGITGEYLLLNYANDSKLYIPISSLHLLSRYVGGTEDSAPLHKLGSDSWSKARNKAAEKVRDVAAELLDVYAKRAQSQGFAFKYDAEEYRSFAQTFPFEETEDQHNAINAVISDMCQTKVMDRLVCGDVGFGKTEVAIRAAFLAVHNHKQVAVLVPTTLLAQQHFDNFKDRFANQAVNIEMISRFRTAKESKNILEQLAEGKIDILIGTHKLLQKSVKFSDLGLLIVDEEHRFGVRQKEAVKQLRANIDILTLTATPIPRTLNMAMSEMRDLSIIATPPARRLSIKTFVRQYDDLIIREALLREILRGGQIYYLHNDVSTIENCAQKLAELVPEARIIIGHGQMPERELERVMSDFYHQRYNVLVCSTIIETGIDIPSANTIIIERADKFGLAQLHQLRGRVGRSHHQAYAYMLTPNVKLMSKDAVKRLQALESLDNLGAGFVFAAHDLEIRGAGELLGSEQSGQIASVGFSLYMELLDSAVEALKDGREPSLDDLTSRQVDIDLHLPALLPEEYLKDVNMRLSFYKRIASSQSVAELNELKVELIDRFGSLPEAGRYLLAIAELRLLIKPLSVQKIIANAQGGFIEFKPNTEIDPTRFIELIQQHPQVYRFDGPVRFRFTTELEHYPERLEFVETLCQNLLSK